MPRRGPRPALSRSSGKSAAVEECLFLRSADTAKHRVAVREVAEAANDVGVQFRPFQAVCIPARAKERDRLFLVGENFRMLERQIEKATQVGERAVETVEDGAAGDGLGRRIGGEGARLSAEHIARELIEQN